jgi:hypothetical protein
LAAVGYFTAAKWAIRHEEMTFYDAARHDRPVAVDIAIRRDKEMQADAGLYRLPVAILSHGHTVKFTDCSFLANVFAARGYMAISIQHDLPTDPADGHESRRALCRAAAQARESIQGVLDKFIEDDTPLKPVEPKAPPPDLTDVGPVTPYVPVAPTATVNTNARLTSSATLAARQ